MLAKGTDEIGGKLLPLVDITAHHAAPHRLSGGLGFFRLGLNVGLVVGVGGRRDLRQHLHILHRGNEEGVGTQVHDLVHRSADVAVAPGGDIMQAVGAALAAFVACKLIHIPPGLEAKVPEGIKAGLLAEDGDVELPAFPQQVVGVVGLVHCNADLVGLHRHLPRCVDDAAALLPSCGSGEDKQAVGQVKHRLHIHKNNPPFLLFIVGPFSSPVKAKERRFPKNRKISLSLPFPLLAKKGQTLYNSTYRFHPIHLPERRLHLYAKN